MKDETRQMNERTLWDNIARSYDRKVMQTYEEAYRLTIEAIQEEVNPESTVVEMGCGTGIIALAVAPKVKMMVGVDISPKMIAQARKKAQKLALDNVSFIEGDGYNTNLKSDAFDMVLLPNLLHVVADPAAILREANRLLVPGGLLLTVTDCMGEPAPPKMWLNMIELRLMKLFGRINYFHFFKKGDLKVLLDAQGFCFEKEAILHPAPVNYFLVGRKGS